VIDVVVQLERRDGERRVAGVRFTPAPVSRPLESRVQEPGVIAISNGPAGSPAPS
jgi:hypothetical protein